MKKRPLFDENGLALQGPRTPTPCFSNSGFRTPPLRGFLEVWKGGPRRGVSVVNGAGKEGGPLSQKFQEGGIGKGYTYTYTYIYIAFRPVCCLLFLAEATFFTLFGGEEEDLRTTKYAFWARF